MKKVISLILAVLMLFSFAACGKSEAVKNVEAEIKALGTITVDSKEAIDKAMSDYEALSDEEKEKVSNYADLEQASADYEKVYYETYSDVFDLLKEDVWYYNGGSDTILNCLDFVDEKEILLTQVSFDGNGAHSTETKLSYKVNSSNVVLILADGSEDNISYSVKNKSIVLNKGKYFNKSQIEDGLQGYWTYRKSGYDSSLGAKTGNEYNMHINKGKAEYESASLAYLYNDGSYYYYGPYTGSYKIGLGTVTIDAMHGKEWFFNVIDGKVTLLRYNNICSRGSGLPGEDGYKF